MHHNREAIIALCSTLQPKAGVSPLTPAEYRSLAQGLYRGGLEPADLYRMTPSELEMALVIPPGEAQRIFRLLDRTGDLLQEIAAYSTRGIRVVTRAETSYPKRLRSTPGFHCPPLFYYAGDLSLAQKPSIGYVGSREIDPSDSVFTIDAVRKTLSHGYGVVSGGARGVDATAEQEAIIQDGFVVEYPADSLLRKLREPSVSKAVEEGKQLLLYPVAPHIGFSTPLAMMRNGYIYAHSHATVVIRSTLNKGGTWAGATEALRRNLCPLLCRNAPYEGNQALIQAGAIPIDHNWDGFIPNKEL